MSPRAATVLIAVLLAALAAAPVASVLHGERLRAAGVAPQAVDCAEAMERAIEAARTADRVTGGGTRDHALWVQASALRSMAWSAIHANIGCK